MAFFQIFSGSFSDKYGRKNMLFVCLIIFILASIGCYASSSLNELIFFRFLQAVGACGGMSIGQAIVADIFNPRETGRILSIIIPLVAFSPAIAPVLGGYIEIYFNWKITFLILAVYGVIASLILLSPVIPKIKKNEETKVTKKSAFSIRAFKELFSSKLFLAYAFFMMASNATYYSFVGASPFLLKKFGYEPTDVGYALCAASFPYMFSSVLGRRLSLTKTNLQIIFYGLFLNIIGGIVLVIMYFSSWHHMLALMIPVFINTIGNGLLMPFSSANAIALFPKNVGMVTGSLGSLQFIAASLGTAIMGFTENGTLLPIGILVLGVSFSAVAFYLLVFGKMF